MRLEDMHAPLVFLPQHLPVFIDAPCTGLISWRGSYDELSLNEETGQTPLTVDELCDQAERAMSGEVFTGYKGGEYTMKPSTIVWADGYGWADGRALTGFAVEVDGSGKPFRVRAGTAAPVLVDWT